MCSRGNGHLSNGKKIQMYRCWWIRYRSGHARWTHQIRDVYHGIARSSHDSFLRISVCNQCLRYQTADSSRSENYQAYWRARAFVFNGIDTQYHCSVDIWVVKIREKVKKSCISSSLILQFPYNLIFYESLFCKNHSFSSSNHYYCERTRLCCQYQ